MAKVSRFTQADINTSLDSLVSKSNMGFCHNFKLQSYTLPDGSVKTLMYFDGCASHLGCTVTLRGGSLQELRRVGVSNTAAPFLRNPSCESPSPLALKRVVT